MTPIQVFSCEYCGSFTIICFEEHLWTAPFIRCYFDTINPKQSGFCTTYSFKILALERKHRNNLKNLKNLNNKKKDYYSHISKGWYKFFKFYYFRNLDLRYDQTSCWVKQHINKKSSYWRWRQTVKLSFNDTIALFEG